MGVPPTHEALRVNLITTYTDLYCEFLSRYPRLSASGVAILLTMAQAPATKIGAPELAQRLSRQKGTVYMSLRRLAEVGLIKDGYLTDSAYKGLAPFLQAPGWDVDRAKVAPML